MRLIKLIAAVCLLLFGIGGILSLSNNTQRSVSPTDCTVLSELVVYRAADITYLNQIDPANPQVIELTRKWKRANEYVSSSKCKD